MMNDIFEQLAQQLKTINGLTKKTAEKMIFDLLMDPTKQLEIIKIINEINNNLSLCEICGYLATVSGCYICSDETRNKDVICVVGSIMDARSIEAKGKYRGLYAILNGEINLSKGIVPEMLKIDQIFNRVTPTTELILALNATFEGEVTANYLAKKAQAAKINVSKIAIGIPLGGALDYMDETTLFNAINNRKKYED